MQGQTIQLLISRLIKREGGFVDHPADRGGPTKYGITLKTLSNWRGYPCTRTDVAQLQESEASEIYEKLYWVGPGFSTLQLHPLVTEMVFDTGVHSGPGRAAMLLQEALQVKVDGQLGPKTRAAAEAMPQQLLACRYLGSRVALLGRIITDNPSQAVFAAGWMNRMKEFLHQIPEVFHVKP